MALREAERGYILETRRIIMEVEAKDLPETEDVKSYKRRKRWLA